MTPRTFVHGLSIITVLLMLLGNLVPPAFGKSLSIDSSIAENRIEKMQAGGMLVHAIASDVDHMDPALSTSGVAFLVDSQIYDTLVKSSEGETIVKPDIAESWSVSSDGLTWTFNIRPNLHFHDGSVLDAYAALYNFQRWWDPAHPFHQAGFEYFSSLFHGFKGDSGCLISNVKTDGNLKFQIVLSRPYSPLPSLLANPAFSIASPTQIQAGNLDNHPVGSGPFKFVNWIQGDRIELARNPAYWGNNPFLDSLTFKIIPSSADRLQALQVNTVQSAALDSSEVPSAQGDPALKVIWNYPMNTAYMGINRAHSPLNLPLVTQAIAHALDKQSILADNYNLLTESAIKADQFLPPKFWGRDNSMADYSYDPTLAQALLTQAGFPTGFNIELWVMPIARPYIPNPNGVALSIQHDLAAVGINATLHYESSWQTYLSRVANGEADLFLLGWGADMPHPENFYYPNLCDSYLRYGARDNTLCGMLENAQLNTDYNALDSIYKTSGQRVHDTLPLIPLAHARTAMGMRQSVGGLHPTLLDFDDFEDVFYVDSATTASNVSGGTLNGTDTQGNQTMIDIPAGAVSNDTTFLFASLDSNASQASYWGVTGFVITAEQNGQPISHMNLVSPLEVTIQYSDDDLNGLDESTLNLHYWDGDHWSSDGIQVISRDTTLNQIVLSIYHLSEFMLAVDQITQYLPLMMR